jgi:hypothetical protein
VRGPRVTRAAIGHPDKEWLKVYSKEKSLKRRFPGKLFYPDEASHIFTKYWDYLTNLPSHPDFASETPICQEPMSKFSKALRKLRHKNWVPQPAAEAPEESLKIAQDAALSRLRPISDGPDQWERHRQSAVTVGPSSLGSSVVSSESTPGLGSTDTCVQCGNPSQT